MGFLSAIDGFLGRMVLRSFGVVFLIGGLVAGYAGVTQLTTAWSARSWPAIQGEVSSSALTGGRAALVYRYSVNGQEFTNNRIFVGEYSGIESHAQAIVNEYPPGPVSVLYDPASPQSSVLEVRFPWTSVLLASIGLILLVTAIYLFRKKASFGEMAAQVIDGL